MSVFFEPFIGMLYKLSYKSSCCIRLNPTQAGHVRENLLLADLPSDQRNMKLMQKDLIAGIREALAPTLKKNSYTGPSTYSKSGYRGGAKRLSESLCLFKAEFHSRPTRPNN